MKNTPSFFTFTDLTIEQTLSKLQSSQNGLSSDEAQKRKAIYGSNSVAGQKTTWFHILIRQLKSSFVYLLFGAALLSFFLGEFTDASMIFMFLVVNTSLGFYQEFRSEKTVQLLKKYTSIKSKVKRDNQESVVDSSELVVGDIVILEPGDIISADIRFLEVEDILVDESILTGESIQVEKVSSSLDKKVTATHLAKNIGFSGTHIAKGKALGIVIATGKNSSLGNISTLATEIEKESSFQKGIDKYSNFVLILVFVTLAILLLVNILIKGESTNFIELLIFSIALAVSVIPEALPVVVTFSLSRGALLLSRHKVVVKRLSAIEDLGSIEVLCTDKTGTLTENSLTVSDIFSDDKNQTLINAALASDYLSPKKTIDAFDKAIQGSLNKNQMENLRNYQMVKSIPFDPQKKQNSVIVQLKGKRTVIVRGAYEVIVPKCKNMNPERIENFKKWISQKGAEGKRVITLASGAVKESNLEFIGAISFVDPIKTSTYEAVKKAKMMGVVIKILTGDSPEVAGYVAQAIKLIPSMSQVITGDELDKLSTLKQHEMVEKTSVFARVSPEQKYKIIQLLQEKHLVGFLGEGINDAPALKTAHVGLAVDKASDIARENSDIILLNRDLMTIMEGVKMGREVFVNTSKYIRTTLSSNFGNFYAVAIVSFFINYLPMLPLQILLLNLVSDFPMIAISTDNVDPKEIQKPENYEIKSTAFLATILGLVSTFFDFVFFGIFSRYSPGVLQTNWFIGSALTELVFLFSARTRFWAFNSIPPSKILIFLTAAAAVITLIIPFTSIGRTLFSFIQPSLTHIILILTITSIYFITTEIAKNYYYKLTTQNNPNNLK